MYYLEQDFTVKCFFSSKNNQCMLVKFHIFIFYNIHDSGISLENSIYSLLKLFIEKNIAYITHLKIFYKRMYALFATRGGAQ